jgi:hypothetical protein
MLKEIDHEKESAEQIAKRKWRNNAITKRIKEEQQRPQPLATDQPPQPADTITNESRTHGPVQRFESKFKRELKEIMQGYTERNLLRYSIYLRTMKRRLLLEKLRRLETRTMQQQRDLFT